MNFPQLVSLLLEKGADLGLLSNASYSRRLVLYLSRFYLLEWKLSPSYSACSRKTYRGGSPAKSWSRCEPQEQCNSLDFYRALSSNPVGWIQSARWCTNVKECSITGIAFRSRDCHLTCKTITLRSRSLLICRLKSTSFARVMGQRKEHTSATN
jgi:hypothetical protein